MSTDLQRIFRLLPGMYLVVAPQSPHEILAASDGYLQATHTDASIFGRPVFDVFPDNPAAGASGAGKLAESFAKVVATGEPDTLEPLRYDLLTTAEGRDTYEERYWLPVNTPVRDAQGTVAYIVQTVEDATAKANDKAVQILESITEGFFTLDRQWRFDYVNSEAHRILDQPPRALTGRVIWEVYPGLEGTEFEQAYQRSMVGREKVSFTAYYPNQQRWYEVTTFPSPEGMAVYFRNVTEQKEMEAQRERMVAASEIQRRIYEAALDTTPDFIYVFGIDYRFLYANEALQKTLGVADVSGKRLLELGYERWHAEMHEREIDEVRRTGQPIRGEVPFTGTNESVRVYDYIFSPVTNAKGDIVAVAGTTRDITDRQATEQSIREQAQQLAEADRSKDEFLATLSHELRNPLAPMRNSIALLRMLDGGRDTRAAPVHAMMERQVNHLVRLVDDLLEVSRISRGVFELRKEKVELGAVLRNALETSEPAIKAAGHTLTLKLPRDPLWLDGDPVRLAQILSNLLNNAATYNDPGGHVTVRAWRDGAQIAISISDDGVGIAPESLPRLFQMFARGDRDRTRSPNGLGIGLALSRRLAQMHNGTLEGTSEGLGQGSEFTLRLPASPDEAPTVPTQPIGEKIISKTRVLVVDDNHDAGDSLAMVLDLLGAEVQVARDGPEALAAFASYAPGVVLLDIGMPGMNGYEVARELRSRHPGTAAKLVALTGWGQEEDRRRAREAGFDHHLVKPAEIDALQELLATLGNADAPPSAAAPT